jgi:hypothetical protein
MHELTIASPPEITQIKNITGISLIFDWGMQDRGLTANMQNQADIVDLYGYRMNEELEYENVRTYYVDTRRLGMETERKRLEAVPSGYVPVVLSLDWHAVPRQHNASVVEFSGDLYKVAARLCESLGDWGKNYVWGHRVSKPVALEMRPVPGHGMEGAFIRIKPFALNGPHAAEYIKRVDKLGEELGRALGEFLRGRGQGLRNM